VERITAGLNAAIVATACLALAGGAARPASAQITTGTVSGTVKDPQGGVIPGATVTLLSETQGTRGTPVVTNATGDFVFPNVVADTYTVQVEMPSFKTLKRSNVSVSPGSRVAVGDLTIEIGGASETIDVKGEAPPVQSTTGERSFTVEPDEVSNLPIADRNFASLAELAPGVTGTSRIGGGGATNFMMDGVSTMDTGSNRLLLAVNVESIAQVKVMTSNYQAEYGRSSGLQITAVTKTGTNRFRGGLYDVERNSDWNATSKVDQLNGDAKDLFKRREWGYSIGGPIGKPGGRNKLFFFYSHEFQPRTAGNDVVRYRVPTALERQGDFSQTTDNNGNLYPYIKDPRLTGTCSATSQVACFADGGVLGRIPAEMLYQTGLNILKRWPLPNLTSQTGQPYNLQLTRPAESILGYQPAIRLDYQPNQALRLNYKYTAWQQRNQTINGSLPGFNDTRMQRPLVFTMTLNANYTLTATTFLEATYGRSQNTQAGCALTGAPVFCTSALAMNPVANRNNSGLANLPFLFPEANVLNPNYYAYEVLNQVNPPIWDGRQILLPPAFSWGSRVTNAPPNNGFPGFLNKNLGQDFSVSVTKVLGRHTLKSGFYNTHSYKAQQRTSSFGSLNFGQGADVGSNPCDTSYGFSNAATGCFRSYQQASSYVEGVFLYNNTEGYVQDNWKVSRKLTLDYGIRLVHQQPQHDSLLQASNFLPEKWVASDAPMLYVAGCVNNANPCSGTNRQAKDPRTGQLLGPNSSINIGTVIPNTGNPTNGIFRSGQGIAKTTYTWPALAVAPRFGMAYDVSGRQRFVLRGGFGLFFDRPDGNSIFDLVSNPPASRNVTVNLGNLQQLGAAGLTTEGAPTLTIFKYDSKLPSSLQWNWGVQTVIPYGMTLDVSWVGHHSFNLLQNVNLNSIDLGSAFLEKNQDLTLTPSTVPGAMAVQQDLMRPFRGYSNINQQWDRGWQTFHSLQLSLQRRFRNGWSLGVNDTIGLSSTGNTTPRLQHNPDGSYVVRDDQQAADELLYGNKLGSSNSFARNTAKVNFVWDLPDLRSDRPGLRALGLVVNDWQLSGVWTGRSGQTYSVGFSYQSGGSSTSLTGSPNFGGRTRLVGDTWEGCSRDIYRQFNPAAFQGPLYNSVGLESGAGYLTGCMFSQLDLAIARNIRFGKGRNLQLRVDMFNAPNQARITGRNSTMNLSNPNDPVTITNLPYDANGNLLPNRSLPRNAGFGVVNGYQSPRSVQTQIRFSF
jgi:hypothetical protein